MGRRSRRRSGLGRLNAPESAYSSPEHGELVLRGSMSLKTRHEYKRASDPARARAAATAEDVWARAFEFLFERLAVRWTIEEVPWEGDKDLLARFRAASSDERRWIRDVLRQHLEEHFPDLDAP
jgi:hypothetical protein